MQKNIHAELLNLMLDLFHKNPEDKVYLFKTLEEGMWSWFFFFYLAWNTKNTRRK